jgi:hypothetical protein
MRAELGQRGNDLAHGLVHRAPHVLARPLLCRSRASRPRVRALLAWVNRHAEMARFVFTDAPDDVLLAAEPTLAAHNRRYVHHIATWLSDRDLLRDRPFEVVHALWFGPSMELCRHWVRGRSRITPTNAAEELSAAAWRAVDGR